jgi:hypothetical protein
MSFKVLASLSSSKPYTVRSTGNETVKVISLPRVASHKVAWEGLIVISFFAFYNLRIKGMFRI